MFIVHTDKLTTKPAPTTIDTTIDKSIGRSRQINHQTRPYDDVVLRDRLQTALATINPDIPFEAIEDAIRKITSATSSAAMSWQNASKNPVTR
jgi:hypothetical protein